MSWEKSVIGTALSDPATMVEAEELKPSDFSEPPLQLIWAEMLALRARGGFDARALVEALRTSADWDRLGAEPEAQIAELLNYRGQAMGEYAAQVLAASTRRALRRNAALIAAEAADERVSLDELLENAERRILSLRRDRSMDQGLSMADLFGLYLPRFEALREGTFRPAWVPNLDGARQLMSYAEDSEYIIIAGRPGNGKSSYLRFEFLLDALKGIPAVIFNNDSDQMDYARNFLALYVTYVKHVRLENTELKNPLHMPPDKLELVRESMQELMRLPLYLVDCSGQNASWIARQLRRYKAEKQIAKAAVDYIQLIFNGIENRVQDVGFSSSTLRNVGRELGVPLLVGAQLSREIERSGREPELADLRDSGTLEQDGTIVAFPRNLWATPTAEQLGQFPENRGVSIERPKVVAQKFYFKKNRNGPPGVTDPIKWDRATGLYLTLDPRSFRY